MSGTTVTNNAGKEIVLGRCGRYGAMGENIVFVGIGGAGDLGRKPEPVLRVRIDLRGMCPERPLHMVPVIADEDLCGEAMIHRGAAFPALGVER